MNIQLCEDVRKAYSAAAERPENKHPFPAGRRFAESIGYLKDLPGAIPAVSVDSFTGVSNVSLFCFGSVFIPQKVKGVAGFRKIMMVQQKKLEF